MNPSQRLETRIKIEIDPYEDSGLAKEPSYPQEDFTIQFNDLIEEVRRSAEGVLKSEYSDGNTSGYITEEYGDRAAEFAPKREYCFEDAVYAKDKHFNSQPSSSCGAGGCDQLLKVTVQECAPELPEDPNDCSKFLEVELKVEDASNVNPESTMAGLNQFAMTNFVVPPTSTLGMFPPIKPPKNMGEGPFPCPICGKRFLNKRALRKHSLIHKDIKPHRCEECGKCFIQRCDLTKHSRVHTGIKNHQCQLCPKTCGQKSDLDKHMLTHTGFKPYACQFCPKTFATKKQLVNHNYQHFGEKPFPCSICNKSFTQKYDLNKHMLTHTGERPYVCCLCHKTYTQSGDLNYHMKVHAGYKPYECDYCHKHFTNKSDLVRHISIHTKEKMHHCLICKSSFREKFKLTRHLKSPRHNKKLEAKLTRKPRKQVAPARVAPHASPVSHIG